MWNFTSITTFFNNLHVKRWANWTLSEYQWKKEFWGFTHLLGYFLFPHVVKCKREKKKFLTIMATSNFHIGSNLVFHSIPTFWWWWVEKKSKRSFRIAQWSQNMAKWVLPSQKLVHLLGYFKHHIGGGQLPKSMGKIL